MTTMSEQTKPQAKSLSDRVKSYFKMKELLEAKYQALLQEVAEVYDPNAKVQVYSGFSFVPEKLVVDEPAVLAQYILDNPDTEAFYMTIQERKIQNKQAEDALVKDACGWFVRQGLEMPKKPRKGYLKLNTKGMKEAEE